jgi:hypothetical protein
LNDPRTSLRLFAFAAPLLFIALQPFLGECHPVIADPPSAVNEAGTTHTIVATLDDPDETVIQWFAFFFIIAGPNEGENSFLDCEEFIFDCGGPGCDTFVDPDCFDDCIGFPDAGPDCPLLLNCNPFGCFADADESISWSYESNGELGTDLIAVCAFAQDELLIESILDALGQQAGIQQFIPPELLPEIIAGLEAAGCEIVTKDWVEAVEAPELPDLILRKACFGAGDGDADFNVLVTQLESTIAADALDCGEVVVIAGIAAGTYTIQELITGPDAANFDTAIACSTADGLAVATSTRAQVEVEVEEDVECTILNFFTLRPQ